MLRLSDGLGACLPGNRSSDDSLPLFDYQPDDSISHGLPLILRPLDRDETRAAFRNLEPAQSAERRRPPSAARGQPSVAIRSLRRSFIHPSFARAWPIYVYA